MSSDEIRIGILKGIRRHLQVACEQLKMAEKEIKMGGFSLAIDSVASFSHFASELASAASGLVLKDGEAWTPTSHPRRKSKEEAAS
jgi:hypothetical protein